MKGVLAAEHSASVRWREDQIERLFDSIMRNTPSVSPHEAKSRIRRRKFIDNYKNTIRLTDFYVPEDTNQLVLDGQQRLRPLIGLRETRKRTLLRYPRRSVAPKTSLQVQIFRCQKAAFPGSGSRISSLATISPTDREIDHKERRERVD